MFSAELLENVQVQKQQSLSEAPGEYSILATVTPLGLMQIRPLQHWLHARIRNGHGAVANTAWPSHRNVTASSALEGSFVSTGIVVTDVSKTGWGAMCNGRAASGTWIGLRLHWNIICLELLAVLRALRRF